MEHNGKHTGNMRQHPQRLSIIPRQTLVTLVSLTSCTLCFSYYSYHHVRFYFYVYFRLYFYFYTSTTTTTTTTPTTFFYDHGLDYCLLLPREWGLRRAPPAPYGTTPNGSCTIPQ